MKRWPNKLLIEVAAVIRGISFDKSQVSNEPSENSIPILRAGNIQDSLLIDSDLVYVPQELVSEEQLMRRGDLAICMSSGSSSIVGKSAHLVTDWRGSVGAFCAIVRFNAQIHHRFGSYWFRSPAFLRWRDSNAKGANIQNLRRAELEKLSVPVPPLAEQERIVKLLDEADELRKLRAQADRRTAAFIPALFHEMFGDPASNPKNWPLVTLGEIGGGGQYGLNAAAMTEGRGVRFIRITDIDEYGRLGRCEPAFVPVDKSNLSDYELSDGDILIARSGATAGKAYIHIGMREHCVFAGYLIRFKINQIFALPVFVFAFLQTAAYWSQLNRLKRAVAQPNVNAKQMASLRFPLPPLPLQKEFAQRVTEIRELEAEQAASRSRLDALFQSMLYRAFNGDL